MREIAAESVRWLRGIIPKPLLAYRTVGVWRITEHYGPHDDKLEVAFSCDHSWLPEGFLAYTTMTCLRERGPRVSNRVTIANAYVNREPLFTYRFPGSELPQELIDERLRLLRLYKVEHGYMDQVAEAAKAFDPQCRRATMADREVLGKKVNALYAIQRRYARMNPAKLRLDLHAYARTISEGVFGITPSSSPVPENVVVDLHWRGEGDWVFHNVFSETFCATDSVLEAD